MSSWWMVGQEKIKNYSMQIKTIHIGDEDHAYRREPVRIVSVSSSELNIMRVGFIKGWSVLTTPMSIFKMVIAGLYSKLHPLPTLEILIYLWGRILTKSSNPSRVPTSSLSDFITM